VPLPTERQKPPRYLSQSEVERLVDEMPRQYRALVLVGAYAGTSLGRSRRLAGRDIDPMRSRIRITATAVELRGPVTLDNEPKTTRSQRSVPVARSVMRRLEDHLSKFVDSTGDALVFTRTSGGPSSARGDATSCGRPCCAPDWTHHLPRTQAQLRRDHGAAGCNVREVSEWAGHNSVAFTLTSTAACLTTTLTPPSIGLMRFLEGSASPRIALGVPSSHDQPSSCAQLGTYLADLS
jgi:integrase